MAKWLEGKSARHPPNQERSIYEWLDLVTDLGAMVKSSWEPIWSRWMVTLRSIWEPIRNRSIVDLVSIWNRFGSIWGPFGVCLGSMLRSGSDSSLRTPRDQISRPLGPILAPLLDPMLAPCWQLFGVLGHLWRVLGAI